jgi:hypothetical protein
MGVGDELLKEECLEVIAKFPPISVISQKKKRSLSSQEEIWY